MPSLLQRVVTRRLPRFTTCKVTPIVPTAPDQGSERGCTRVKKPCAVELKADEGCWALPGVVPTLGGHSLCTSMGARSMGGGRRKIDSGEGPMEACVGINDHQASADRGVEEEASEHNVEKRFACLMVAVRKVLSDQPLLEPGLLAPAEANFEQRAAWERPRNLQLCDDQGFWKLAPDHQLPITNYSIMDGLEWLDALENEVRRELWLTESADQALIIEGDVASKYLEG